MNPLFNPPLGIFWVIKPGDVVFAVDDRLRIVDQMNSFYLLSFLVVLFTHANGAPIFRGSDSGYSKDGIISIIPMPTTGANRELEKKPWLVFSSAGDHSAVGDWLPGREYDVMVAYYGKQPESFPFRDLVDIYRPRKDCKFCNLKYFYKTEPDLFKKYSAVAVLDDDIQISSDGLNRLFSIREKYDLWITTPAMKPQYHSPWYDSLAAVQPQTRVRIVPFIEMDCPMFKAEKLWEFVKEFDPVIKGWGTDVWYTQFFGPELQKHQAVADCVTAINPPQRKSTGKREILDYLGSDKERKDAWETIVRDKHLETDVPPTEGSVKGNIGDLSWSC